MTLSRSSPASGPANAAPRASDPAIEAHVKVEILKLIEELDKKEQTAAEIGHDKLKWRRYAKKESELKKKSLWNLRNRTGFSVKLKNAYKYIDEEMGAPKLPRCYEEVKRLLYIDNHPIFSRAAQEWSRKETLFTGRVELLKTMEASVKSEIFQLIGWFVAFQSFLFTGVTGSNLLHCNNKWYPILFSILASLVTVSGIVWKMIQIKDIVKRRLKDGVWPLEEARYKLNKLRRKGIEEFEFAEVEESLNREDLTSNTELLIYLAVMASLFLFAIGFPLSFWKILCHSGYNPYAATVPRPG